MGTVSVIDVSKHEGSSARKKFVLKKWKLYLHSHSVQKCAMLVTMNELKTREILYKYSSQTDVLDSLRTWRVYTFIRRRRKGQMFHFMLEHYLLSKALRKCALRIVKEGFKKLRRRCKWAKALELANLNSSVRVLWVRWRTRQVRELRGCTICRIRDKERARQSLKSYIKAFKIFTALRFRQRHANQLYQEHEFDRMRSCILKLLFLKETCSQLRTINHVAILFWKRKAKFSAFDHIATRYRGRRMRSHGVRHQIRRRLQSTSLQYFTQFQTDSSFFKFGNPLVIDSYQRSTLLVGCLSQLAKAANKWSCEALQLLRILFMWKRRLMVRINRRIRCRRSDDYRTRNHWKLWKTFHCRVHYVQGALKGRAVRHWSRLHLRLWCVYHMRTEINRTLHQKGYFYWMYCNTKNALRQWRKFAVQSAERNNLTSYFIVKKGWRCLKYLMFLKGFKTLSSHAELKWQHDNMKKSLRWWWRWSSIRCKAKKFVAVQSRYKQIVQHMTPNSVLNAERAMVKNKYWKVWKMYTKLSLHNRIDVESCNYSYTDDLTEGRVVTQVLSSPLKVISSTFDRSSCERFDSHAERQDNMISHRGTPPPRSRSLAVGSPESDSFRDYVNCGNQNRSAILVETNSDDEDNEADWGEGNPDDRCMRINHTSGNDSRRTVGLDFTITSSLTDDEPKDISADSFCSESMNLFDLVADTIMQPDSMLSQYCCHTDSYQDDTRVSFSTLASIKPQNVAVDQCSSLVDTGSSTLPEPYCCGTVSRQDNVSGPFSSPSSIKNRNEVDGQCSNLFDLASSDARAPAIEATMGHERIVGDASSIASFRRDYYESYCDDSEDNNHHCYRHVNTKSNADYDDSEVDDEGWEQDHEDEDEERDESTTTAPFSQLDLELGWSLQACSLTNNLDKEISAMKSTAPNNMQCMSNPPLTQQEVQEAAILRYSASSPTPSSTTTVSTSSTLTFPITDTLPLCDDICLNAPPHEKRSAVRPALKSYLQGNRSYLQTYVKKQQYQQHESGMH